MSNELYTFAKPVQVVPFSNLKWGKFTLLHTPHNLENDNLIKSETFELFRRNNRNVDIITYDELFERAYHMVCLEKIPEGWYGDEKFDMK